jgi:hypothetical protein
MRPIPNPIAFVLGALTLLASCMNGSQFRMTSTHDVPAATGTVEADVRDDGNVRVEVDVDHLAPPRLVSPQASEYIVWIQPPGGQPTNAGILQVGSDRDGELRTLTTHRHFDVFVTAEPTATASIPSGDLVLHTRVRL